MTGRTPPPAMGAARADIVAWIASVPLGETPAEMRAGFARLARAGEAAPAAGRVTAGSEGGVPVLTVRPSSDAAPGARRIVWLHGGGYVFGSPETHLRAAAALAEMTGTAVTLPRYRRAPEHVWPAPLEDALAVLRAQQDTRTVLVGGSAGGHLALNAALALARAGTPLDGLVLLSPNTDRSGLSDTRARMDADDPMVDDAGDARLAAMMFPNADPRDPDVSPVLDDLSLLPATHVEVGDPEVLLGDARVFHERAVRAGADVSLHVAPGLLHMSQLWTPWWAPATASLTRVSGHVARVLGA